MSKGKELFIPVITLTVICLVMALCLGVVNSMTAPVISANQEAESKQVAFRVLPQAADFNLLPPEGEGVSTVYQGVDASGEPVGYVFRTTGNGYGGAIEVLTGFDMEGKIVGVKILSDSETPGLGKKAGNDSFLSQYEGLDGEVGVVKQNPRANDILAVSGATISSKGVTQAVNLAQKAFAEMEGTK